MTRDPFLGAHEQRDLIFNISTDLRPASIRDQIIRGSLFAARAFERGVIRPAERQLLVVGAGVAGAACAVVATRLGVRTTLVDLAPHPFPRQLACTTKRLEPTVYDWPSTHWHEDRFPWLGEDSPLSMATLAPNVSAQLWTRLLEAEEALGVLTFHRHTTLDGVPERVDKGLRATLLTRPPKKLPTTTTVTFGAVVLATGPGDELDVDQDGALRSFRFWEPDPLDGPLATLRNGDRKRECTVVISGAGDGALQDVLRTVFAPRTYLGQLVWQLPLADLAGELATIESHATAAFLWWANKRHRHDSETFVHDEVEKLLDQLWKAHSKTIDKEFSAIARTPMPNIVFVHSCTHFTRSYLVNRVLVGLVVRWTAMRGLPFRYEPKTRLANPVTCRHVPATAPRDGFTCYPQPHQVQGYFEVCGESRPAPTTLALDECHLVLLRHGIDPTQPLSELRKDDPRMLRQILPAHLAHDPVLRRLFRR